MPYTKKEYPDSLKNFMAPVRNKAIDIATAKAEEWALKRSIKVRKDNAPENKK